MERDRRYGKRIGRPHSEIDGDQVPRLPHTDSPHSLDGKEAAD
jgi:hypothetical protein